MKKKYRKRKFYSDTSRKIILCPKCLRLKPKTVHHIYPVRFFGDSEGTPLVYLCFSCHKELERLIPHHREACGFYIEIVQQFLSRSQG